MHYFATNLQKPGYNLPFFTIFFAICIKSALAGIVYTATFAKN